MPVLKSVLTNMYRQIIIIQIINNNKNRHKRHCFNNLFLIILFQDLIVE